MYDMNLRYSVHVSSEMIKESFSSFHCNYHVVILHMKDIFIDIIKKKKNSLRGMMNSRRICPRFFFTLDTVQRRRHSSKMMFKLSERSSTIFNQALMYRKEGWRFSLSEKRKYRRLQIGLGSRED